MNVRDQSWHWWLGFAYFLVLNGTGLGNSALAQINPDDTLGSQSSVVMPNVEIKEGVRGDRIDGGAVRGTNLFHSFEQFNIPAGKGAYFANPAGIENILSRVTGGNVSQILGTLGVAGNANLFLMNPNGIVFGPNARLDVSGAFVATSASGIRLGENGFFSATDPQMSNLLTIQPSALTFTARAGGIINRSNQQEGLQVPAGQTLALVGGNVDLEGGRLRAAGGRIELGSVASAGEVSFDLTSKGPFNYDSIETFGNIRLQDDAKVNANGSGGGNVQIQGTQLDVSDSSISADTTEGDPGGEVVVRTTDMVTLRQESQLTAQTSGAGDAGDLTLDTGTLLVRDGSKVSTTTFGAGNGGRLSVNATESIRLIGYPSGVFARSEKLDGEDRGGRGGSITINTPQLLVEEGGAVAVTTRTSGDGENLTVAADSIVLTGTGVAKLNNGDELVVSSGLFAQVTNRGEGDGGDLTIETGTLLIKDGAEVSVSTNGAGDGGRLSVNATESIRLIGFPSGIFARTERKDGKVGDEKGRGGSIVINTPQLLAEEGGAISVSTQGVGEGGDLSVTADSIVLTGGGVEFVEKTGEDEARPSGLFAQVINGGEGNGGDLAIETGTLLIQDGAEVSASTDSAGNGGSLSVNATESIRLIGYPSGIFARAVRKDGKKGDIEGSGGSVAINTPQLLVEEGATVSVTTGTSKAGGNLMVTADSIVLNGSVVEKQQDGKEEVRPSGLFARARNEGDGGNLTIDTGTLLVEDGAEVSASTRGSGDGGSLEVNATELVQLTGTSNNELSELLANATPDATSENGNLDTTGDAGNLNITTPQLLVEEGARILVNNDGQGKGGDLTISADFVNLDGGSVSAETASNTGGDITIQGQDLLLLQNNSKISTTAGTEGAGGDGGNITIDTDFVVALQGEDNNITANAFEGNGGEINIKALSIIGIEFQAQDIRDRNDITASSEFGVDGTVEIDSLDVDPSEERVDLPNQTVEAEVAQVCTPGGGQASEFVVTGRGGLPSNPYHALESSAIQVDWIALDTEVGRQVDGSASSHSPNPLVSDTLVPKQIVEAQGWVVGDDGRVILTARAPATTSHSPWQKPVECNNG